MVKTMVSNLSPAVGYSAYELSRYLGMMAKKAGIESSPPGPETNRVIKLGLFEDLGIDLGFELEDRSLDDAYVIDVKDGSGIIAGSNSRSVLLGVYRFLRELGCRWVRPGKDGERIPALDPGKASVKVKEKASYRHRTVCIEGAVSLENVIDVIDWMPKAGFSGFYMQFREGYTFFNRWYSREENYKKKREQTMDLETAREFTRLVERELLKRGLFYHSVGHGWHTEIFGIPAMGWFMEKGQFPQEFLDNLAIVDGRRMVPWNNAMLAALCYSDEKIQERLAREVANYAEAHPEVDYVHFWLDDWYNNKCECERCAAERPADHYIRILNRIDEKLTEKGLSTKVVFLAYCDLLWVPRNERLKNPGRFVFMYANGRKDYSKVLKPVEKIGIPEYKQNKNPGSFSVEEVAGFLQSWMNFIDDATDSFIFEYYSGADTIALARVVSEDIKNYCRFGLNGLVNCQQLRVFFPNGLGMELMGRTLWNKDLSFDEIADDYFQAAYGEDGRKCFEFTEAVQQKMEELKKLVDKESPEAVKEMDAILELVSSFEGVVDRNLGAKDPCLSRSWHIMKRYLELIRHFLDYYRAKVAPHITVAWQIYKHRLDEFIRDLEDELQPIMQPSLVYRRL